MPDVFFEVFNDLRFPLIAVDQAKLIGALQRPDRGYHSGFSIPMRIQEGGRP
jgi:hypothetical protein